MKLDAFTGGEARMLVQIGSRSRLEYNGPDFVGRRQKFNTRGQSLPAVHKR